MKVLNKIVLFLTVVSLVACGPKKQDEEPIDDEPPIDDFIDDGDDEEEMIEYNEEEDNLGDDDEDDLSLIKNAFTDVDNYSIDSHSYFNKDGLYNYYRHYFSNYVNDKTVLYTPNSEYAYPHNSDYLSILNKGYLNKDNDLYSFSLVGEDIETRLSSKVEESSLIKESENDNYQNHIFTLNNLNEQYFINHFFKKVAPKKYMSTDSSIWNDFIDITSFGLNNEGYYMTFKKVTIEILSDSDYAYRIRLYANDTQIGKLDQYHANEEYTNWYLLFSEAYIYNIGTTSINPISDLV